MTLSGASGPPGPGPGPSPLTTLFSDRVGEELVDGGSVAGGMGPMSRVLRTLDAITAAELDPDGARPAVGDPTAEGSGASDSAAPTPDGADGAAEAAIDGRTADSDVGTADGPTGDVPAPERPATSSRRETILDAAAALFAERGYHGASLRDISRRVGISHPGMLHHFASKELLLGAVIDRLEAHAQGLLDSVEALQTSPQSLVAALAGPWDPRERSMGLLATLSAEVVDPDHPGRFRIARLRLVHEHVLERVLSGLQANGRLVPGEEPKFLARTLFSLLLSLTVRERTVRELQRSDAGDPISDVQAFVERLVVH